MEEHQVATIVEGSDSCKDLDQNLYQDVVGNNYNSITEPALQAHYQHHHHHRKDTILHFAVRLGRMDCIKQILEKCPSLLACRNSKGDTALHIAARNGRDDIVGLINPPRQQIKPTSTTNPDDDIEAATDHHVEYSATIIRMENDKKDTALHEAVRNHRLFNGKKLKNYLKVLKLLTEADREFECFANYSGETPLYMAAEEGVDEFVFQILEACPSSAYGGPYGRTALHSALFTRHETMVRKLLEKISADKRPDMIRKADDDGRTPLHFAALWSSPDIAEKILLEDKSVAYKPDKRGVLPVHLAAQRDGIIPKIFFMFYEHCPDCFEYVDDRGWNALHFAVSVGAAEVLHSVLLSRQSNELLKGMANEVDKDGNTPLHLAIKSQNILAMDTLLRSGIVDILAVNNLGLTPLDLIEMETKKDPVFTRFFWTATKKHWKGLRSTPRSKKLYEEKVQTAADDAGEIKEDDHDHEQHVVKEEKRKETHLLVATLVATVTFAAGFTMPGGYNSDSSGTAILTTKPAFQAFVISNTLSMVSAVAAVFLHFWGTLYPRCEFLDFIPGLSVGFIMLACVEMVSAFLAGTYVVLRSSHTLAVSVCCICCIFYLCVVICVVLPHPIFMHGLLILYRGPVFYFHWLVGTLIPFLLMSSCLATHVYTLYTLVFDRFDHNLPLTKNKNNGDIRFLNYPHHC